MSCMPTALQPGVTAVDAMQQKHPTTEGTAGSRSTSAGSSSLHSSNHVGSPESKSLCPIRATASKGLFDSERASSAEVLFSCAPPGLVAPPGSLKEIGLPPGLEEFALSTGACQLSPTTQDAESFAQAVALAALDVDVEVGALDTMHSPVDMFQQPCGFGLFLPPPPPQSKLPPPPQQPPVLLAPMESSLLPPPPAPDRFLLPPPQQPPSDRFLPPPPQKPPVLSMPEAAVAPPPPVQAPLLRLADSLPEPTLGATELLTVGSTGHRAGNCKPCAFFHAKGCKNGTQCQFCHLCPQGEKKRRLKETRAVQRKVAGGALTTTLDVNTATAL